MRLHLRVAVGESFDGLPELTFDQPGAAKGNGGLVQCHFYKIPLARLLAAAQRGHDSARGADRGDRVHQRHGGIARLVGSVSHDVRQSAHRLDRGTERHALAVRPFDAVAGHGDVDD